MALAQSQFTIARRHKLTRTEALEAFAKNDGRPIKVKSRGGVVYWLYVDVVDSIASTGSSSLDRWHFSTG